MKYSEAKTEGGATTKKYLFYKFILIESCCSVVMSEMFHNIVTVLLFMLMSHL